MTTATQTLTEFLMARIAEDEAMAQRAGSFTPWDRDFDIDNYGHLTVQNTRVLAECEAKRRIVEEHRLVTDPARLVKVWRDPTPGVACERCANDSLGDRPLEDIGPCDTLLFLAAVYSDHPDFQDIWRA